MTKTLTNFKQLNLKHDGHFFDRGAMEFFNSKIESSLIDETYFITSERRLTSDPKKYTVRKCDWSNGDVITVDAFNSYDTLSQAKKAIKAL